MAVRSFDIETIIWSLESVLPDFRFEVTGTALSDGKAAAERVLDGTNTKSFEAGGIRQPCADGYRGYDVDSVP